VVTPTKEGYQFSPASQSVTIADANKEVIDFTATAGYTISGKVTVTGVGLSGVTMTLSGGVSLTTTTDSLGDYSFNNLGNGTYIITPSKEGYGFSPLSETVTISGANQGNIDFSATLGYTISGQVTLKNSGLSGVTITLSGDDSDTTITDSEGNYVFTGLSDGSYTVTPSKEGYEFDPSSQEVTISGASEINIDFTAEVLSLPKIFFIAPISSVPGQILNIIGKNFGNEPGENGKVNFGTKNPKIRSWSNWKILIDIPKGSGKVKVSVTTDEGTSNEKNFFYIK
jgi:hypothetical protein